MKGDCESAKSIFLAALEIGAETERRSYIDAACGGDGELHARVEKLLKHHAQSDSFLESPAQPVLAATTDQAVDEYQGGHIGPYKIRERIGDGGMGVVYVAEQEKPLRRKVALKVIKPGMDSKAVLGRFEAERNVLALMDHPHIAKVLDAGTTVEGRPYFVMELVNGIPITQYCDEQRLSVEARLRLFVDVCRAIQHAHQKGIIHRDIKPSNVLVTELDGKPVVKVIDFGVAKALNQSLTEHSVYTAFQSVIGTPLYMSPEQASFSSVDVDTRSDVYSLGVLLYELVTGTTPVTHDEVKRAAQDEVFRLIREIEPPRPSNRISSLGETATRISQFRCAAPDQLGRLVKGDLDWIVMKALSKERSRRYDSANHFCEDVERYLNDDLVEARPPSAAYRLSKFYRRNRSVVTAIGLVVLALSIGLGVAIQAYNTQRQLVREKDELLAELRQSHLDEILEAVLSGNTKVTSDELQKYKQTLSDREVESDQQLRVHQALIDLFGDDRQRVLAYERLTRLVHETPQDLITQALYVVSQLECGRELDYYVSVERLLHLSPQTFEEYVFRGFAISHAFPQRACEDLSKALQLNPSSALVRCLLSDAYHNDSLKALDRSLRIQLARAAVQQADLAVEISPADHVLARKSQLEAYTGLLDTYLRQEGTPDSEQIQDCIDVIKRHLEHQRAAYDWRTHAAKLDALRLFRKYSIAIDDAVAEGVLHLPDSEWIASETIIKTLQLRFQMGELAKCAEISDRYAATITGDSDLAFLAEIELELQHNPSIDRMRQAIKNRIGRPTPATKLQGISAWPLLKIIGEDELAQQHAAALIKCLEQHEGNFPAAKQLIPVYRWLMGGRRMSVDQLVESIDDSNALNHAAVGLGVDALVRGERNEAKRLFELAESSPQYEMYDSEWAIILVNRMSDTIWPAWLHETR